MQYTTFDFNGSATTNDIPNGGWDFSDGTHLINFTLGVLQQQELDHGVLTCNVYGCMDPNSFNYNSEATHPCDAAPSVWLAIRQWHLDNDTQDEDDIPWEICGCDTEVGLG